jgi:subtilase family serine protease
MRQSPTRAQSSRAARQCYVTLLTSIALVGLAVPTPAGAAGHAVSARVVRVGVAPRLPHASKVLGALAQGTLLHLDFALQPRDPASLFRLAVAVSTPGGASYHHFLSAGAFAARFGVSTAEVESLDAELRHIGLSPGPLASNRLSIAVTASAGVIEHALDTPLVSVSLGPHRLAEANTAAPKLPIGLAAHVLDVLGLDSLPVNAPPSLSEEPRVVAGAPARSPHLAPAPSATCQGAIQDAYGHAGAGFSADQVAAAYSMEGLYQSGDTGAGTNVAVIEFSPFSSSDLATYAGCYGINPTLRPIPVDGGPASTDPESQIEAELDIEQVMGLAPGANVLVYEGPNQQGGVSGQAAYDTYRQAVEDDAAQVITTSWGSCEPAVGRDDATAESVLFAQAALQGQTVVAAAGDEGAEDCHGTIDGPPGDAAAVDDPAAQPFVTGVGGTTLTVAPSRSEVAWNTGPHNSDPGAGGGGVSAFWSMPTYQRRASASLGVLSVTSAAPCGAASCREVPDLSMNAGAPYAVYCTESFVFCSKSGWTALGGTSAASPAFAAIVALADSLPGCAGAPLGFINPALYGLEGAAYASSFNDITSGNNDLTGTNGGHYAAGAGYDLASGLGSPIAGNGSDGGLIAQLCGAVVRPASTGLPLPSLSAITPHRGARPLGGAHLVLHGTDLAGATSVHFGATPAKYFHVTSDTSIVVVVPPGHGSLRAGAVHIRVTTRAGTSTRARGDLFEYLSVPSVTGLSETRGRRSGGQRVVITGDYLHGTRAVLFGDRAATSFRQLSPTRLVATTPAGHGGVFVRVVTASGRSPVSGASRFNYTG